MSWRWSRSATLVGLLLAGCTTSPPTGTGAALRVVVPGAQFRMRSGGALQVIEAVVVNIGPTPEECFSCDGRRPSIAVETDIGGGQWQLSHRLWSECRGSDAEVRVVLLVGSAVDVPVLMPAPGRHRLVLEHPDGSGRVSIRSASFEVIPAAWDAKASGPAPAVSR